MGEVMRQLNFKTKIYLLVLGPLFMLVLFGLNTVSQALHDYKTGQLELV